MDNDTWNMLSEINATLDMINTNLEKLLEPEVEVKGEHKPDLGVQIPGTEHMG